MSTAHLTAASPCPSTTALSSTAPAPSNELELGDNRLVLTESGLEIHSQGQKTKGCRACLSSCLSTSDSTTTTVPLYNILWAEVQSDNLHIFYADQLKPKKLVPRALSFPIPTHLSAQAQTFASTLHSAAYNLSLPSKRLKVLINPFGGKGTAAKIFEKDARPLLEAARCELDVYQTTKQGEAVDIARELDINAYDAIVCCSGDGIPHEVFNGLGQRKDAQLALRKMAVAQLPGGSGNAMCINLTGTNSASVAALSIIKGTPLPIDLISITQGTRRFLSFLSQSFGIVAECDLGTENMRWMGEARFTVGMLKHILNQTVFPCDLAIGVEMEGKEEIREHWRKGSNTKIIADVSPSTADSALSSEDKAAGEDPEDTGLPPLKYGTIADPLPPTWHLTPHPTMGNFYAGNMTWMSSDAKFFPASLPHEGLFDVICIDARISRTSGLKTLLGAIDGSHFGMEHVLYRKVVGYRIIPRLGGDDGGKKKDVKKGEEEKEGYISIDGEKVPFEPFQAEVHKGLGRVLGGNVNRWENSGV